MNIEIERKYLVKHPPGLENFSSEEILQGYLLIADEKEIRIRKKGNNYYQAVKVGQGLKRQEIEREIGMFQFEEHWPETEGRRIEKRRYMIYYDAVLIELDVYSGELTGLITAEVDTYLGTINVASYLPPRHEMGTLSYTPAEAPPTSEPTPTHITPTSTPTPASTSTITATPTVTLNPTNPSPSQEDGLGAGPRFVIGVAIILALAIAVVLALLLRQRKRAG